MAWVSFLAWFRELSIVEQAGFILLCQCEIDTCESERIERLEWQQALVFRAMALGAGMPGEDGPRRWHFVDADEGAYVVG